MKNKCRLLLAAGVLTVTLAACSNAADDKKGETDQTANSIIFYTETGETAEEFSLGDLYIQQANNQPTKLASRILNENYKFDEQTQYVYYLNEDDDFYRVKKGQEPEKIAASVQSFQATFNGTPITYTTTDAVLYQIDTQAKPRKIANNPLLYKTFDQFIYYVDEQNTLKRYDTTTEKVTTLAQQVADCTWKNDMLFYTNLEAQLYVKTANDERLQLSEEAVYDLDSLAVENEQVYYTAGNEVMMTLYASSLKEAAAPVKIAPNAVIFKVAGNMIYYITENNSMLYAKNLTTNETQQVATNVDTIDVKKDKLFFSDYDSYEYMYDGEKAQKMTTKMQTSTVTDDGTIVYLDEQNTLYANDEKLAEDVNKFSLEDDYLVYSTNDQKLYKADNIMSKATLISADLDDYSVATYANTPIYWNTLDFKALAGEWVYQNEQIANSEPVTLHIQQDGTLAFNDQAPVYFEFNEEMSSYNRLEAAVVDGVATLYVPMTQSTVTSLNFVYENEQLTLNVAHGSFIFKKIMD